MSVRNYDHIISYEMTGAVSIYKVFRDNAINRDEITLSGHKVTHNNDQTLNHTVKVLFSSLFVLFWTPVLTTPFSVDLLISAHFSGSQGEPVGRQAFSSMCIFFQ